MFQVALFGDGEACNTDLITMNRIENHSKHTLFGNSYVYIYIYTCIYTYMYIHVCVYTCAFTTYTHVYIYIYMYIMIALSLRIYIHNVMYVYSSH